jgi:two-component system chemotaxis response regulator CheB
MRKGDYRGYRAPHAIRFIHQALGSVQVPPRLVPTDIVALAASAGGLAALARVLGSLSSDFPAAIVIVQHLQADRASVLAQILARSCKLTVVQADEGAELRTATAYVAPPDFHLVVRQDRTLTLSSAARVRFVRPSADILFASVATVFGPHAIGVVLTGTGKDAADGVTAIKRAGGRTIAQDRTTSQHFAMPEASIGTGFIDYVLPLNQIAGCINDILHGTVTN